MAYQYRRGYKCGFYRPKKRAVSTRPLDEGEAQELAERRAEEWAARRMSGCSEEGFWDDVNEGYI